MSEKRDYYDVLGLKKGAPVDEVRKAYKDLAKKFHPDVSRESNAEEKFKELLEAYSVLSDPQKKENYDRFGHAAEGFHGQGFSGFSRDFDFDFSDLFSGAFSGFEGTPFEGVFSEAFGGRRRGPVIGRNLRFDLNVSFEDAAFGVEKELSVQRLGQCSECGGFGGKGKQTCGQCNGSGIVRHEQRTPFGLFATQTPCNKCNGSGQSFKERCGKCGGKGKSREKATVKVKIPAGIDSGNHLRLKGLGEAGENGGPSGDLFIVVFVQAHEIFRRDGCDVFCEVPLSFSEAALGASVDVPTLKGKVSLKVPPSTQSGTIFRLHDKGIKNLEGAGFGDEFVKVIVQTPDGISRRQRELFEELSKEDPMQKKRKGLFDKIMDKFK